MKFFWRDKPWIGHSGDDEDDDPCLSEALLQVSDEFDSLSCLCDADDSFILVASAPCTTASSLYNSLNCLHQPTIIAR